MICDRCIHNDVCGAEGAWESGLTYCRDFLGWIPVSERLPEESTAVLIWCPERKNIYCAYLEEKQWWIFGAYFQKVPFEIIAWMPLPEPFKPQERSDKE